MTEAQKKDLNAAISDFLKDGYDEAKITDLTQSLDVALAGTTVYVPTATRIVFDRNFGKPVMAFFTKTDVPNGKVYWIPTDDLNAKGARKLRISETMGGASLAFGIPLRKLGLKLPNRRFAFTLKQIELTGMPTVYEMSFADFEHAKRNVAEDPDITAAKKQVQEAKAQARKEKQIRKIKGESAAATNE